MTFRISLLSGALALVMSGGLMGCGGGGDVASFVKLDTAKAEAFKAGGDDCETKAESVGEWRKNHNADYKAMQKKLEEAYPEGPPDDVMAEHGEQLQANKKAVMDAMMACSNNEAFGKMMDETKVE